MKKFLNKRFISVLCALVLILICCFGFAVAGGAWGMDDIDGSENVYEAAFPIKILQSVGADGNTVYGNYDAGAWPSPHYISVSSVSDRLTLFRIDGLNFKSTYGLGLISSFDFGGDINRYIESFRIYFLGDQSYKFTYVDVFADGSYQVVNSVAGYGLFEDDFSFIDTGGQYQIFTSGTLKHDLKSVWLSVVFNDAVPLDKNFVLQGSYFTFIETAGPLVTPSVDRVTVSSSSPAPYYPGSDVQLNAEVSGTGIVPGAPESTVYWYVHGNTSVDTDINNDGLLTIANDETATVLEVEAISTYDSTKSATLELTISYPLEGVQIVPSGPQYFTESAKRREIQYNLFLPNGDPFDYLLIEWYADATPGHESYFRIDDTGLLTIEPNAPAGSSCTIQFAYQSNPEELSPVGATVKIVTQQEGIYDQLTPTPDQSDKADQMEDAIGDAADKLENNNSSLGQLTPSRPQINTDLQLDSDSLLAVSPLVTNIWSINGMGRMIGIVLMVATVAYIFFGKRDG